MRLDAAASTCLRSALAGPARPATWLGATPAALYLRTAGTPGVLALLTHDAVRLPCALVLPTSSAELPLTSLTGDVLVGDAMIGDNRLAWTGPAGPVIVGVVREWGPARVRPAPQPRCWAAVGALAALRDALPAPAVLGIDGALLMLLATEPATGVTALLGRGPGLTPAGDDVLAGFLLGTRAVGLDAAATRAAVATLAAARTTALSAALLWHAARGECIDEVAAVLTTLHRDCDLAPALGRLLRVGHTSGAALATGLSTAALAALRAKKAGEAA